MGENPDNTAKKFGIFYLNIKMQFNLIILAMISANLHDAVH